MKLNATITKQPRKKRKAFYQGGLHLKQKSIHVHLSKDLKKKFNKRSMLAKKGDTVRVMRGTFRKREGKISSVDTKHVQVFVEGVIRKRQAGQEVLAAFHPSNLVMSEYQEPKHKIKKSKKKAVKQETASKLEMKR